jgi:hypothetical protein
MAGRVGDVRSWESDFGAVRSEPDPDAPQKDFFGPAPYTFPLSTLDSYIAASILGGSHAAA